MVHASPPFDRRTGRAALGSEKVLISHRFGTFAKGAGPIFAGFFLPSFCLEQSEPPAAVVPMNASSVALARNLRGNSKIVALGAPINTKS